MPCRAVLCCQVEAAAANLALLEAEITPIRRALGEAGELPVCVLQQCPLCTSHRFTNHQRGATKILFYKTAAHTAVVFLRDSQLDTLAAVATYAAACVTFAVHCRLGPG